MGTSPGRSLWSLLTQHAPAAAMPRIRAALGQSLVDTYTELYAEAEMWHRIWCEGKQSREYGSRAGTPRPRGQGFPLPDPPVEKELLRAEVKMLLQNLKESASRDGRDDKELLSQYEQKTVNYALGHRDSRYSNCTNPPNADNESRLSSPCPVLSSAEDQIVALRDKLSVTEIDQVVEQLRCVFTQESQALIRLINNIQENLKKEGQGWCDHSEPSLADLRELREALQADLELYRSSSAAFSTNKDLKRGFRSPAEQSINTLGHTSMSRPHLVFPLSHKPKPPNFPPPTKNSLSKICRQHRITSAPSNLNKTPNRMDASAPADVFPSTPPPHGHLVATRPLKSVQEAETETPFLTDFHLASPPTRLPT